MPRTTDDDEYQWLSPREHALHRPDTYAGGINPVETTGVAFLPSEDGKRLAGARQTADVSPALFKVIDEPIQNAMDNRSRDDSQTYIRMSFDDAGVFSVANDGHTIPIRLWKDSDRYTHEILFSELMSGENFDDKKKRIDVGGRNGLGIKITALLSTEFVVESVNLEPGLLFERVAHVNASDLKKRASVKDAELGKAAFEGAPLFGGVRVLGATPDGRLDADARFLLKDTVYANTGTLRYVQRFETNLSVIHPPEITRTTAKDRVSSTSIRFTIELPRLGMAAPLSPAVMAMLRGRAYDVAACTDSKLAVYVDDKRIPFKCIKDYAAAFGGDWVARDLKEEPLPDGRVTSLEVCVARRTEGTSPVSIGFVNGIRCSSGTHMDLVYGQLRDALNAQVAKQLKGTAGKVTAAQLRERLHVVVSARIVNPSFTTQSKDRLESKSDRIPSYACSGAMIRGFERVGLVKEFCDLATEREDKAVAKSLKSDKSRVGAIPKYERALKAGNKKHPCHLYITEGDSAKGLAVAGFSVIGREYNGVYPLRGKFVNVNGMSNKTALEHKEVKHLTTILGLDPSVAYTPELAAALPYQHLVIFTDQDNDGSHIMGLVLNWLVCFYPTLLLAHPTFVKRFATPIIRARVGSTTRSFFTQAEYRAWSEEAGVTPQWVKYYKGLGTSTNEDAKNYFRNIDQHMITVRFNGDMCRDRVDMWFHKKRSSERKIAVAQYDGEIHVDYAKDETTMADFCSKELVGFAVANNERSLCNVIDGLKPSQRKALFSTLSRKKGEVKVAQLAAGTAELTAYHHGEQSMVETIVHMAQPWMGANNVALLAPNGMFGSRHMPREEHSAARYIFTEPGPLARHIFPAADDAVLEMAEDDGKTVEPRLYAPVVAMLLVNGSKGIGTGWRNECPAYAMPDIIANTRKLVADRDAVLSPMEPSFLGFKGTVAAAGADFVFTGTYEVAADGKHVHITELPPRTWTGPYIEALREKLVGDGPGKYVLDIDDVSTTDDVHVVLRVRPGTDLSTRDLVDDLDLRSKFTLADLNFWDADGHFRAYANVGEIMRAHADFRREMYVKRRAHLIECTQHDVHIARNRARYVREVNAGTLSPSKLSERALCDRLRSLDYYDHDNFDYLRKMGLFSITTDRAAQLDATASELDAKLAVLVQTTAEEMWRKDLDALEVAYAAYETETLQKRKRDPDAEESKAGNKKKKAAASGSKKRKET